MPSSTASAEILLLMRYGNTSISIEKCLLILAFYYRLWWWMGLSWSDVYLLVALPTHSASWTCSLLRLFVALSWFLRWSDWQIFPVLCLFQFYLVISLDYVSGIEINSVLGFLQFLMCHFFSSVTTLQVPLISILTLDVSELGYVVLLLFPFVGYETISSSDSTRIGMTFTISGMFNPSLWKSK